MSPAALAAMSPLGSTIAFKATLIKTCGFRTSLDASLAVAVGPLLRKPLILPELHGNDRHPIFTSDGHCRPCLLHCFALNSAKGLIYVICGGYFGYAEVLYSTG